MSKVPARLLPGGIDPGRGPVFVTPVIAAMWLATQVSNRHLRVGWVKHLAGEMSRGEWLLNGATIVFDEMHRLLDGQHRLQACVESQKGFWSYVIVGVAEAARLTQDLGSRRSIADNIALADGEKVSNSDVAATTTLWRYLMGQPQERKLMPSIQQVREVRAEHPALRESLAFVAARKAIKRAAPPSVSAFVHYGVGQVDSEARSEFFAGLEDGAGLLTGSPVLLLRNRLADNRAAKAKLPAHEIQAIYIKAWNAFRRGESLRFLRWRSADEPFPRISGWLGD